MKSYLLTVLALVLLVGVAAATTNGLYEFPPDPLRRVSVHDVTTSGLRASGSMTFGGVTVGITGLAGPDGGCVDWGPVDVRSPTAGDYQFRGDSRERLFVRQDFGDGTYGPWVECPKVPKKKKFEFGHR